MSGGGGGTEGGVGGEDGSGRLVRGVVSKGFMWFRSGEGKKDVGDGKRRGKTN